MASAATSGEVTDVCGVAFRPFVRGFDFKIFDRLVSFFLPSFLLFTPFLYFIFMILLHNGFLAMLINNTIGFLQMYFIHVGFSITSISDCTMQE